MLTNKGFGHLQLICRRRILHSIYRRKGGGEERQVRDTVSAIRKEWERDAQFLHLRLQSSHITCASGPLLSCPILGGHRYHANDVFVRQTAHVRARFAALETGSPHTEPSSSESVAACFLEEPFRSSFEAAAAFSSIC